jgi:hypothetical protein
LPPSCPPRFAASLQASGDWLWVNDDPMTGYPPQTRSAQSSGAKIAYRASAPPPGPGHDARPGVPAGQPVASGRLPPFVRARERGGRLIRLENRGTPLDPAAGLPTARQRTAGARLLARADSGGRTRESLAWLRGQRLQHSVGIAAWAVLGIEDAIRAVPLRDRHPRRPTRRPRAAAPPLDPVRGSAAPRTPARATSPPRASL